MTDLSVSSLLDRCDGALAAGRPLHICTLNPEIVIACHTDRAERDAVSRADLVIVDGIGVSLAIWRRYGVRARRITGAALVPVLADWARERDREVVIIGAREGSRRAAEGRLRGEGVRVRCGHSPMVQMDGRSASLPEGWCPAGGVVFVALGAPKQELWIRRRIEEGAGPNIYIGVGGAIDYYSGATPPPPRFVCELGMEWLYRLWRQPARFRRQAQTLPRFVRDYVLRRRDYDEPGAGIGLPLEEPPL